MSEEFQFCDSYEDYIMNYLTQIESESNDVLDMLSHKNTKNFFYQFNQYLAQIGKPLKLKRHTADDNNALSYKKTNGSILLNICWKKNFK